MASTSSTSSSSSPSCGSSADADKGTGAYFQQKIEALVIDVHDRTENLRRLEAQRNDVNAKGMISFLSCFSILLI